MFRRKSYILRIGKYHVLLLQVNIYYKNNGESGWFNDRLLQELLIMLKEPIQRRLSVKLEKDKKTKQDEFTIGTGTTMKFGFQFVNKEMYQPFVIPDNKDNKFRSLCLFEEKLKVTVCPLTASSVEDKATTILLNSSSQFSKEAIAISNYFNKCQAVEGLTTESAQKKRCKLKRIVKQGTLISEAQYNDAGGFIPDDGSWEEPEKQDCNDGESRKETEKQGCNDGGSWEGTEKQGCNDGGSWEETEKQGCNDKTHGGYIGNGDRIVAKKRGTLETKGKNATKIVGTTVVEDGNVAKKGDNKETEGWNVAKTEGTKTEGRKFAEKDDKTNMEVWNVAIKKCTTETQVENLAKKDCIIEREVLNVAKKRGTTEIEVWNELKEGGTTVTGGSNVCKGGLSDGRNGGLQDINNGALSAFKKEDTVGIGLDLNVGLDGRIYVNNGDLIEASGIRENLNLSNDSNTEKEYGCCNRKHKSRNDVQRVTDFNQSNVQNGLTLPANITKCSEQYKDNDFKPKPTIDGKKKNFEVIHKNSNQVEADKIVKGQTKDNHRQSEKLLSGDTAKEKHFQCRRYGSALSELTNASMSTGILLDEESKPSPTADSNDDQKSHFTGEKNNLQKMTQRSKLSLKRQNKDNLKASERAPKKARRSMSFDLPIADEIMHKENAKEKIVETTCSTEINLTKEADAIVKNVGFQDSSKTSVNNDSIQEQETHRQSRKGVDEVRTVDSLSSRSLVEENALVYQNQPFIKVIETEEDKVTAPKVYTCQSDDGWSDNDLFMNDTEQEDNDVVLLPDFPDDSWIIGSSAQQISKPSEHNSRSPQNEVSSCNRLRRISEKICVRFERDASITNIESDSKSSPLADEYRKYCNSPNDDSDFLEVCVNEQFDVGEEVGFDKRNIDVEMVTSSDDDVGQDIRYSNSSNQKQDEMASIAMSPELISDDDQDSIIASKKGYHSHEGEASTVKQPQEFTSNTLMDLTTDTSGDDLPSVSFSTHQLHTNQHSLFDHSTDQVVILDGTKKAAINLNSPEPVSPVFGKRKMLTDQTSTKFIRLNFDSESEDTTLSNDPVPVPISKKSKYKFKMRDKSQTTSRPVANVENCESKIQTNKENVFTNDAASRHQLKPKKRFSQLWVKNINKTCSKKKSLFSFGITGCKKDEERKDAKKIETINLLDDEYESELEEGVLKVRNIDGLNLEAIAFIVWKNQKYLTDIFQGKSHFSVRHENYKKGGVKKADLDFKVPLHMFSDEQVETVVEILVKIFCSKGTKYWDYVMKVLLAEALIKIYMDIHHINYNEAQEVIDNMKNSKEYLQ